MESQERCQSLGEASGTIEKLIYKCYDTLEIPIVEELCTGAWDKPNTKLLNHYLQIGKYILNSTSVEQSSGSHSKTAISQNHIANEITILYVNGTIE